MTELKAASLALAYVAVLVAWVVGFRRYLVPMALDADMEGAVLLAFAVGLLGVLGLAWLAWAMIRHVRRVLRGTADVR